MLYRDKILDLFQIRINRRVQSELEFPNSKFMKIRGAEKWNVFLFSHIKVLQHFVFLICDNLYLDNFYLLWEIKVCFPKPEDCEAFSSTVRYISELIFAWLLFHFGLNANVSFGLFLAMLHFSVLFPNPKIHVQQKNLPHKKHMRDMRLSIHGISTV